MSKGQTFNLNLILWKRTRLQRASGRARAKWRLCCVLGYNGTCTVQLVCNRCYLSDTTGHDGIILPWQCDSGQQCLCVLWKSKQNGKYARVNTPDLMLNLQTCTLSLCFSWKLLFCLRAADRHSSHHKWWYLTWNSSLLDTEVGAILIHVVKSQTLGVSHQNGTSII